MVVGSNPGAAWRRGRRGERRHSFAPRLITSEGWSGRSDREGRSCRDLAGGLGGWVRTWTATAPGCLSWAIRRLSVTRSLGALGHLGRWMDSRDIDAEQLNGEVLKAFLADHVDRHGQLPSAGVMPLLDYLRSVGVAGAGAERDAARRLTGSSMSTGTGWRLSGRSRLTPSAATRGWQTGFSRNESRPRMSSGSSASLART